MAKDKFGEAVYTLEVNNKAYEAQLRKAEDATRTAATKMQGSLSKVSVASTTASSKLGVAAASAGLLGGAAGAALGPIVGMASAVSGLGLTLKTAIPLVAALAAGLAAATFVYRQFAAASKLAKDAEEERLEILERFNKRLLDRQNAENLAIKALEKRIRLAKGAKESEFLTGPVKLLQLELERLERVKKREADRAASKKRFQEEEKRRLEGIASAEKRIADEAERLADAKRKERAASQLARETGRAPVETLAEAFKTVKFAAQQMEAANKSQKFMLLAVRELLRQNAITAQQAVAISGIQMGADQKAGAGNVGGGIAASFFRGGRGGAGVVSASPEAKANRIREKQLQVAIDTKTVMTTFSNRIKQLNQMNP